MNKKLLYKLIGYFSVAVGISASLCIYRIQYMFFGLGLAILGFVLSGINIFMNMREFSHEEKYPKGYIGMVLSSLPILFMLFVIFRFKH